MNTANSLKSVARGGVLFSLGTLSATGMQFITGIIVIRLVAPSEYGLISLAYMLTNILVTLAALGFGTGLPRFLAQYQEEGDELNVGSVIGTALLIAFSASILFAFLLYFGAHSVAASFKKPDVQEVLKAFVLMVPPLALITVLNAIFRGLGNAKAKVLFHDILLNLVRMLLLLLVVVFGFGYRGVLWIYVGSVWIPFAAYIVYAFRKLVRKIQPSLNWSIGKKLMLFSMPLLGVGIMTQTTSWTGILTMAYLQSSKGVALFNAPLRLVNLIPIPLMAMVFLYLPVATRLIQRRAFEELGNLYVSTTKWAFLITLPLLLYFLVDAEFIVERLFGEEYREAANVLRVLTVGFSFHTFLGPNGMTLISYGNTRVVFLGTTLAAASTVVLCLSLVPDYGACGAALGIAVAQVISNLFISIVLYMRFCIHPFSAHYVKPVLFAVSTGLAAYALLSPILASGELAHLLLFLLLALLALLAPLATMSMTWADMDLLGAMERRLWGAPHMTNLIGVWMKKGEKSSPCALD